MKAKLDIHRFCLQDTYVVAGIMATLPLEVAEAASFAAEKAALMEGINLQQFLVVRW